MKCTFNILIAGLFFFFNTILPQNIFQRTHLHLYMKPVRLTRDLSVYLHLTFLSADLALCAQLFEIEEGHFQRGPPPFKPPLLQHTKEGGLYLRAAWSARCRLEGDNCS